MGVAIKKTKKKFQRFSNSPLGYRINNDHFPRWLPSLMKRTRSFTNISRESTNKNVDLSIITPLW